jgi:hypothetical protein
LLVDLTDLSPAVREHGWLAGMPVTREHTLLASAGCLAALGGVVAFRAKATLPFKLAYAAAWPLLGSAAVLLLQPAPEALERGLSPEDAARLAEVRRLNRSVGQALKEQPKLT